MRMTTAEFIEKARKVHGEKYDYSLTLYVRSSDKVKIVCPEHGVFEQRANDHLQGANCHVCGDESRTKTKSWTTATYIEKVRKVHGDKYDYSKTVYKNARSKVEIICPEHGVFKQGAYTHLRGGKCNDCSKRKRYSTATYIEQARKVHSDKYDYSKTVYSHSKSKVKIVCPEHGVFEQRASAHIDGAGCAVCKLSTGELIVEKYLKEKKIKFETQKTFKKCKDRHVLPFDFYLPDFNLCIEYHGAQHYRFVEYFHKTHKRFELSQRRDQIKRDFCKQEKINLLEISYKDKDKNKIKDIIKKYLKI